VDIDRYKPELKNPNSIVFATRLHKFKNPDLYVDALGMTLEKHPQAEFHLLGTGPLREHIAKRLRNLGINSTVDYRLLWDTSKVLNRSSINVQLQQEDNYPSQSILEGMASGNAIIATDVGLTRRLVNEENGILIPVSDAGALADAMISMLEHPKETLNMGMRSREKVLREHTIGGYVDYLNELYDRASMLARPASHP
jgi:glycosyltransferase involved in cell wall biosynthesis